MAYSRTNLEGRVLRENRLGPPHEQWGRGDDRRHLIDLIHDLQALGSGFHKFQCLSPDLLLAHRPRPHLHNTM